MVAGLLAGYGIAIPVGAVATYLVALTARTSLRTGASAALGVASADGLYALTAALGGTALAPLLASVTTPLRWTSAVVLLALAVRGFLTAVRQYRGAAANGREVRELTPLRAYLSLLGITLLNPVTIVYFTALVLGSGSAAPAGGAERTVFVLAAFAASASWQLLLAGGGALLGRALTGRRGRLATAAASSALIAGLAVGMVVG
ncbi:Arginine exporter protein ArgO [Streptomyces indicus]|uniref:Arginine exporter protein ArgO n=1 Tax=Streptomyces indicus TaxID=417292 RepID=A0A1G9BXG8_9ACTN|nr:Arginine exporter protein ArgO [Streptomyces indicus]